ncbi:MAG: helix-hairpin-helix domain-containing protein [Gemmataceae bacterium]
MSPSDANPTPAAEPILVSAGPDPTTETVVEPTEGVVTPPVGDDPAPESASADGAPPAEPEVLGAAPMPSVQALPPQPVPEVLPAPQASDLSRIAQDLQIRKAQVETVTELLDEGNTVPFITRYRKDRTGGLDEDFIRRIQERIELARGMVERKRTIFKSIAGQGRLTDELIDAILKAEHPKRLEDLYLPFKPKKRTLASDAREKGLDPLAQAIWSRDPAVDKLDEVLPGIVDPWKQLHDVNDVLTGVKHILAELVSERAEVRGPLRAFLWDTALIVTQKIETVPEGKGTEYKDYFDFKEPCRVIPPHRMLAVNRGEKEQIIRLRMEFDRSQGKAIASQNLNLGDHPHRAVLESVVEDAVDRLVIPSLEREIRRDLTDRAQERAIHIFAQNLRSLLLQPPLRHKRVLAIDPGQRSGCKVAILDETGVLLEECVIHPHAPQKRAAEAKRKLEQLVRKYQTTIVAIGNGTACRETEQLVSDFIAELEHRRLNPTPAVNPDAPVTTSSTESTPPMMESMVSAPVAVLDTPIIGVETSMVTAMVLPPVEGDTSAPEAAPVTTAEAALSETVAMSTEPVAAPVTVGDVPTAVPVVAVPTAPPVPEISLEGLPDAPSDIAYVIVNEAGASDYSASPVAKEEFPTLDATARGTVSIGRRLQDPLAELVKIDPQHVGVGLYQHDVRPKQLKESLEKVVQSCVNHVGVDLNTASVPLLRHVSGLNQHVAREIVEYRKANGPFKTRDDLQKVPNFGEKRFTQAAGFLKILDSAEPLDATWIHPESYETAKKILTDFGFSTADLADKTKLEELREKLQTTSLESAAEMLKLSPGTVRDLFESLARPGRDPREDLPPPVFKKGILKLEDLSPGMELKGTVLNVVDFGAFVDVGLKDSGLVHISQIANRYIKSPYDIVAVGDVVTVWVMQVDQERRRVSLTMISPNAERRAPEPRGPRGGGGGPRGERGEPRPEGAPMGERQDRPRGEPRQDRPRGERPQGQGFGAGQGGGGGPGQGQGFRPRPFSGTPPQGGGGGRPQGGRGPRPGGGGFGGRPNMGNAPGGAPAEGMPPPAPRKPQPPRPLPNLSAEKKSGKAPLNTFAELAAMFKKAPPPPPPAAPETPDGVAPAPAAEEQSQAPTPPPPAPPAE